MSVEEDVWCTNFHVEGHYVMDFPRLRGFGTSSMPVGPVRLGCNSIKKKMIHIIYSIR